MSWETAGGEVGEGQSRSEGRCWGGDGARPGNWGHLVKLLPPTRLSLVMLRKGGKASRQCPAGKERVFPGTLGGTLILSHFFSNPPNSWVWGPRRPVLGESHAVSAQRRWAGKQSRHTEISARPNEFQ